MNKQILMLVVLFVSSFANVKGSECTPDKKADIIFMNCFRPGVDALKLQHPLVAEECLKAMLFTKDAQQPLANLGLTEKDRLNILNIATQCADKTVETIISEGLPAKFQDALRSIYNYSLPKTCPKKR